MSDPFTKWVEAIPMPNQRADTVAFVDKVVPRHGVARQDRDRPGAKFWVRLDEECIATLWCAKTADFTVSSPN